MVDSCIKTQYVITCTLNNVNNVFLFNYLKTILPYIFLHTKLVFKKFFTIAKCKISIIIKIVGYYLSSHDQDLLKAGGKTAIVLH